MRHRFDQFILDTERFQLLCDGTPCPLEPRVFDLIVCLVESPGQVFSREELVAAVWQGRYVADATVSTCVKNARKALGDSGTVQRYIETVRGRGFRFRGELQSERGKSTAAADVPAPDDSRPAPMTTPVPASTPVREPTLLILPFRPLSEDGGTAQLTASLGDDLLRVLMRIPLLRLATLPVGQANRDILPGVRELHETLGADFVLEGSVQAIDARFQINVGLSDAAGGFRLWSERSIVSGPLSAAFETAVIEITARLEPQLHRAIYKLVDTGGDFADSRKPFLTASSLLALKGWHPESFSEAAGLLRQSWQRDPGFALAASYLSLVLGLGDRVGLMSDRETIRGEALAAAERALELDNLDSTVLGFAGCALADLGQPERALPILRNAVDINTANAQAWAALGAACLTQQQYADGIAHLRHGIAISPLDSRLSIWGSLLTAGLLRTGELDEALEQGRLACQRDDRNYLARVGLAGVHLARDESESAVAALNDAYRIKSDLTRVQISALLGRTLSRSLLQLQRQNAPH